MAKEAWLIYTLTHHTMAHCVEHLPSILCPYTLTLHTMPPLHYSPSILWLRLCLLARLPCLLSSCLPACDRSGVDFISCQAWNWALYSLALVIGWDPNGGACGLLLYTNCYNNHQVKSSAILVIKIFIKVDMILNRNTSNFLIFGNSPQEIKNS